NTCSAASITVSRSMKLGAARRRPVGTASAWPSSDPTAPAEPAPTSLATSQTSACRRRERLRVDDEAELHVTGDHAVVGLVDLIDSDRLDPRAQPMLVAEVQHLLGLADAADVRAGEHLRPADQRAEAHRLLLRRQSHDGQDAARAQQS